MVLGRPYPPHSRICKDCGYAGIESILVITTAAVVTSSSRPYHHPSMQPIGTSIAILSIYWHFGEGHASPTKSAAFLFGTPPVIVIVSNAQQVGFTSTQPIRGRPNHDVRIVSGPKEQARQKDGFVQTVAGSPFQRLIGTCCRCCGRDVASIIFFYQPALVPHVSEHKLQQIPEIVQVGMGKQRQPKVGWERLGGAVFVPGRK